MKTYYKLMICFIIIGQHSLAQSPVNIYTPKGSLVMDTYISPEALTAYDIQYINGRLALEYPNAIKLQEATSTYNCHAYAWHMVEGGGPVWMGWNLNPTSIYWTDGSYVEVNSTQGTKVSYASDNHSAITTSDNNVFISKWGAWPLVRHQKDDCPYNSSNLKYYKKALPAPTLTGPSLVCDQATYTINDLPAGATVTWTKSPRFNWVSLSDSSATVSCDLSFAFGGDWVKAHISFNGNTIELLKTISGCRLDLFMRGPNTIEYLGFGLYVATVSSACGSIPQINYEWWLDGELVEDSRTIRIQSVPPGTGRLSGNTPAGLRPPPGGVIAPTTHTLQVIATSSSEGSKLLNKTISIYGDYVVDCGYRNNSVPESFILYPNPASDYLTVEMRPNELETRVQSLLVENDLIDSYIIWLWHEQNGMVREIKSTERVTHISLLGLPKGMYFVHVKKEGEVVQKQILWVR